MAFLNEAGLATFLSYLKAWVRATFASKTDTQTIEGSTTFSQPIIGNLTGNCSGSSDFCTGNAATATKFASAHTVALTGDVTGSASSQAGWSVATTLSNSGVTAGSYGPSDNATPAYGATFNVPYITVDAKGRVTAASTKTVKIPASDDTNNKVTQTVSTENLELPLLAKDSNGTTTVTSGSKFAVAVKLNPSTGIITATKFVGPLTGNVTGTCSGNAGSATKLATARSISAGNLEFQGSANFDGSGDINLNITQHSSIVGIGNTNNYSFHRIAYISTLTGDYADRGITFLVSKDFSGGGWGICRIILRTNNATGGQTASCSVQWLVRSNEISADSIQVGFVKTAGASYLDVFYKSSGAYNSAICRVLACSNSRTSVGRGFTVIGASTEVNSTTATDPKTSVESYKTIADAGTALHNQAYTDIIAASDAGVAGQARKLSTSRTISLTGDVSGSASFDGSANASITATVADDSHNHVISNVDGLQTELDGKAGKATTIAGYGITDAKIENGEITLGSNTITPLTSHQSLSNYCTLNGAQTISATKTFSKVQQLYREAFHRGSDSDYLQFSGGSAWNLGARITLYGESTTSNAGNATIRASSSSATKSLVMQPGGTFTWNGQNIQVSSDERIKTPLSAVPDAVLDAWGDVQWGQFQYIDAVAEKGESARLHVGLIAQRVKAAFDARGLDACAYGILCHEERPATADEPAVDLWMVRYAEAQAMEAAFQRRRADRLEARIAALEEAMR